MSLRQARNAIEGRFNAQWAGRTAIAWDNAPFEKPSPQVSWVRIAVDGNVASQAAFGSGVLHRNAGLIFVQVFAPENTGTSESDTLAQAAADALAYQRITASGMDRPVRVYGATIRRIGESDGWRQTNVTIEFEYDEVFNG